MRAVFFDLDGTLVDLPDDFAGLFESTLREFGVAADPDRHEFYLDAFFGYLRECHSEPYRAAMADLREEFALEPTAESLAESYVGRETAATDLRPGVHDALDAPDCPLGVLTNGGARVQSAKLTHHEIAGYFDAVVVSGDVGAGKPDPAIFQAAQVAIPADEYVFVADDLERDVLPAQEAGFTGVHLADEHEDTGGGNRADETISSLREAPDVLGR